MKIADVRAKDAAALKGELMNLRKEQFNLRIQRTSGQLQNTARVRAVRKDIARIKTVLAEMKAGKAGKATKAAPKKKKTAKE